ncbi:hypothetical protein CLOM_g2740 [Closterium sp. NIES-68]|nr:hypothetical protein CLOM_g2740 [Closterium sp. NIES-68]GJP67923.1 hypothetical protein CLOP_g24681 [Closterium sp. NIES-67]GJP70710.1 hypothetical protein CLOP_g1620 [Closterium sp. NIES-67]
MAVAEFPSHHMESTLIGRIPHGDDTLHGQAGFPSLRFSQDWQQRHQEHQKKAHDMWRELQQKRPARPPEFHVAHPAAPPLGLFCSCYLCRLVPLQLLGSPMPPVSN